MAEGIASETKVLGDDRIVSLGNAGDKGLAKIKVGVEKALQADDLDVGEFGCDVGDRVLPANLAVGDDVEPGFQLVGDSTARHLIFGVEKIRGIAFAAIERGDGATENLEFVAVADAWIAAG